jgi:hypothetical protein
MPNGYSGREPVMVSRTDKRSWIILAITGFGALLLRYLRTVRERAFKAQPLARRAGAKRKP